MDSEVALDGISKFFIQLVTTTSEKLTECMEAAK